MPKEPDARLQRNCPKEAFDVVLREGEALLEELDGFPSTVEIVPPKIASRIAEWERKISEAANLVKHCPFKHDLESVPCKTRQPKRGRA